MPGGEIREGNEHYSRPGGGGGGVEIDISQGGRNGGET